MNPGNLHDSTTFMEAFDEVHQVYGQTLRSIGLDAGYKAPYIARELIERKITPLMPYSRPKGRKNNEDELKVVKKEFKYDKSADVFHCPNGKLLTPRSINKETGYITYRSNTQDCKHCPFKDHCLSKTSSTKTLQRHLWQSYMEEAEMIRHTSYHSLYYPKRKQTIERIFADGKEKHGLRYTRYKGLKKVQDYTYLLFACMNMKKIAIWSHNKTLITSLNQLIYAIFNQFNQRKTRSTFSFNV